MENKLKKKEKWKNLKKHEKKIEKWKWKKKNEKKEKSHPPCLCRHWEVWKYHRSIDKWKDYKLRKRYEVTKRLRSYEKGTKRLRKILVTKLPNYVVVIRIC